MIQQQIPERSSERTASHSSQPHLPPPATPCSSAEPHKSQPDNAAVRSSANVENIDSNKDLLALHNGAWGNQENREISAAGQEKIIRAFGELMRNMARMKTFIRPSMCKPYGKQSESLQKSIF